jgi:pyruvate,water dikinase
MAPAQPDKVASARDHAALARATRGFARPADFFVQRRAEGVDTIAVAFWPRPAIDRLSDFKADEYAGLVGGAGFEPHVKTR